jgi:hypothetical protein
MDNVLQAQQDGVWATQQKNTKLLTNAFYTTGSVVLLFSVNKSMAFQGAAIMTTPPDTKIALPSFCRTLRWPTSPAFKIRWLCVTSTNFRFVGHIRNRLYIGDKGEAFAVVVGKDGQEVDGIAGEGVLAVMKKRENKEKRKREREEEMQMKAEEDEFDEGVMNPWSGDDDDGDEFGGYEEDDGESDESDLDDD